MPKPYVYNGVLIGQGAAADPKTLAAGQPGDVLRVPAAGGEPGMGTIPPSSLGTGTALSVLGVADNVDAARADIVAALDGHVLRRSGTAVGFGTLNAGTVFGSTDLPLANLAQGPALSVLGVAGNATADHADIVAASNGQVLRRSGTTVGFGTVATAGLGANVVTYATMQQVSAASRLLGRGSAAGAGDVQEITLGTGLGMSGTAIDTFARAIMQFDSAGGTVAAGSTVFLGAGTTFGEDTGFFSPVTGSIMSMYIISSANAGAAQSFTYTLRKNFADTALVVTIAGVTNTGSTTGSIAVSAGEYLAVRLLTTAGAGVGKHQVAIAIKVTA